MRFNFTGNVSLNGMETKNPYIRKGKTSSGYDYMSFNMSVVAEKNNRAYVECFGMKQKEIKTMDTDGNKITVSWEDRNDEDVVSKIANYKKHIVSVFGDRKEFTTEWDMINYIVENIDEFKDLRVVVTGNVQKNEYQGKMSNRFVIQNIYAADDEAKNALKVNAEVFFGKNDLDFDDWADEKKIYINGYTNEFLDKNTLGTDKGENRYVPQQFIFDASKIDFENEKHVKLLKYKLRMLGCDLTSDNKIKCKLGAKNMYSMMMTINYQNGAEAVEFDESMLTDVQKEAIELGLKKVEDFRPAGQAFGNRVTIFKVVDFDLRGKYEDGIVEADKISDFEESVYTPTEDENIDDVMKKAMNEPEPEDDDDDDDDLFS